MEISKLLGADPLTLALIALILLIGGFTGVTKVFPILVKRLVTSVEVQRTQKISENVERSVSDKLLESLGEQLLSKNEERGKTLHQHSQDLTALNLKTARHDREIRDLKASVEDLRERQFDLEKNIILIQAAQKYQTEKLEELCERIEKLEAWGTTIARIDAYFQMRTQRMLPDITPEPRNGEKA